MGGFQVVEPIEGNSTFPAATTGAELLEADAINVQARSFPSVEGTNTDAERGAPRNRPDPEEGRVTILTLEMLRELVKDPEFNARITEEEIMHRSKGDALSKIIFILQSSWFILQLLARHGQGLGLTQLELTALALVSLNGITFMLWWDKPLGAQALMRVYLKRKLTNAERNVEGVSCSFACASILTLSNCSEVNLLDPSSLSTSKYSLNTVRVPFVTFGQKQIFLLFGWFDFLWPLLSFSLRRSSHLPSLSVPPSVTY